MIFAPPTDSPVTGAQDSVSAAIEALWLELWPVSPGTPPITPNLISETQILLGWNSWADYYWDVVTRRAPPYGGMTNAQRLEKVLAAQAAVQSDLAEIKTALKIPG